MAPLLLAHRRTESNALSCSDAGFMVIGRASLARENESGGSWGQEVHILHGNIYDFVLFWVVLIELFRNSVFQLYCPKNYYKQKQWNTLPVTMITEIMNCNRLLWWLPWQLRQVLVFGDLD